jgi:F0F1-type ATP synthase membrane subunit b/b'
MINISKEFSDTYKKIHQGGNLWRNHRETHGEEIDKVNHNVQDALKKFHDTKNKEQEKTQEQINELTGDFNKHWSETKDIIKQEISELKMTTQNIKEELNKDLENFRKKNQTEILEIWSPFSKTRNRVEGHSSRLQQV